MLEKSFPTASTESSDTELEQLRRLEGEQASVIKQLRERIQELEARLAKDNHNSRPKPKYSRAKI